MLVTAETLDTQKLLSGRLEKLYNEYGCIREPGQEALKIPKIPVGSKEPIHANNNKTKISGNRRTSPQKSYETKWTIQSPEKRSINAASHSRQ